MKRFALFIFAILLIFPISASAQDTPPPPPLSREDPDASGLDFVPYYVKFTPDAKGDFLGSALQVIESLGGKVRYVFDDLNTLSVNLPPEAVAALSQYPNVAFFEPVPEHYLLETLPAYSYRMPLSAPNAPTAPNAKPQVVPWNIDQFQARDVWDVNRDGIVDPGAPDGTGVKFCIIDTGFYAAHDDFQGIVADGISQIAGEQWYEDGYGHGTHVAGIANAVNNNIGVVGVMPGGAELYIVKIFDNAGNWVTGQSDLGAAARACRDAGANVISMSLGGGYSATEEAIFQDLYDNYGIVNVAAAGNDGDATSSYPASYDAVISVAAIDEDEVVAEFSQYPNTAYDPNNPPANVEWDVVELSGGGVAVLSTLPGPPHGDIPTYEVIVNGVTYDGIVIDETPNGDVTAPLVDGGLCDATNAAWNGQVVLCERGSIAFSDKINNVGNSGGVAALIYNNVAGNFSGTCGGGCTVSIPALSLSQADGQYLQANELGSDAHVISDNGSGCTDCTGAYGYMSGTSMATPGVAAGLGFTWSACGGPTGITNKQLRQLLRDTAKDLTGTHPGGNFTYGPGWDVATGWGLIQLKAALDEGHNRFGSTCPLILLVEPPERNICTLTDTSTTFDITLNDAFVGTTNLTVSGAPAGSVTSFAPNPVVSPATTSTLTVSNLDNAPSGNYTLVITATDAADPANISIAKPSLNIAHASPGAPTLISPADGSTGVSTSLTLTWAPLSDVADYEVQVATDPAFNNLVVSVTGVTTTSYRLSGLAGNTVYYWRVRGANSCGTGAYSTIYAFRTGVQASCTQVLLEPGFEGGPHSAWGESSAQGFTIVTADYPRTGTYSSWLGGAANENSQVWQSVALPSNVITATLTYWYWISSNDVCNYDFGYLRLNGAAAVNYDLCANTDTGGYVLSSGVDMLPYAGTSPEIRFQATTDGSLDSSFLIDDASLEVCTPAPAFVADYSDLTSSYGIAWHTGNGALYLGSSWTADSSFADGNDDASDDGLSRVSSWLPGQSATITVTVNGTGNPWLAGWVDWNGDGVFTDPAENILDQAVSLGENTLTFAIPGTYVTGTSVRARFRLYDNQPTILGAVSAAQPLGEALSGEVEDYTWDFSPTAIHLLEYQAQVESVPDTRWIMIVLILAGFILFGGFALFQRRVTNSH